MRLSALPKSFGLTELKKGYFPHFSKTPENQNYIGPFPDPNFYGINNSSPELNHQKQMNYLCNYTRTLYNLIITDRVKLNTWGVVRAVPMDTLQS